MKLTIKLYIKDKIEENKKTALPNEKQEKNVKKETENKNVNPLDLL